MGDDGYGDVCRQLELDAAGVEQRLLVFQAVEEDFEVDKHSGTVCDARLERSAVDPWPTAPV